MPEEKFCPLYREAVESKAWEKSSKANRGLLFDKFGSAWRENSGSYEFDKDKQDTGKWLNTITTMKLENRADQLKEALARRLRLVEAMGGVVLCVKNTSRFVAGMGRDHPLENGFTWHYTLGEPYLPGSSVKGILRSFYREEFGELLTRTDNREDQESWEKWEENSETGKLFGNQDAVGKYIFLDMLPVDPPKLTVDVMTPHYSPYYSEGETPGDWHSPNPIKFLAVEEKQKWHLAIVPMPTIKVINRQELEQLCNNLYDALDYSGAGAKTAVGYGRLERCEELVKDWEEEIKRERRKQEEESREREILKNETPVGRQLYELAKSFKGQEPYVTWHHELMHGQFLNSPDSERREIAVRTKTEMQAKKKWKTSTAKKKPLKDKAYTKTCDIMKILGEANSE